jgi:hypothetical protein
MVLRLPYLLLVKELNYVLLVLNCRPIILPSNFVEIHVAPIFGLQATDEPILGLDFQDHLKQNKLIDIINIY